MILRGDFFLHQFKNLSSLHGKLITVSCLQRRPLVTHWTSPLCDVTYSQIVLNFNVKTLISPPYLTKIGNVREVVSWQKFQYFTKCAAPLASLIYKL